MDNNELGNELLIRKYGLHNAPEVDWAATRHLAHTSEKVSQNILDRIQNYLNRFHEITDRSDPNDRERGISAIKRILYNTHVIKPSDIPEGYWDTQRRIIKERGQAVDLENIDWENVKTQNTEAIISDQESSLNKWVDYLLSPDASYADSLKYWTLRSILNMASYDKERKIYPQRSNGTTKPFPDLNREALAYVLNAVEKKYKGEKFDGKAFGVQESTQFEKLLQRENFPKMYAWAIEKVTPADAERLSNIQGQWVKYDQGSDHMPLVYSIQGHGTGWCTAGESTAEKQLLGGDFYLYYSNDSLGKPTIPRAAIRMEGSKIGEVRGIAPEQNLDPFIAPVVEQKLEEFPDGKEYQKKVVDMKLLTEIDHKTRLGTQLEPSDISFLYEVDTPIQGFGFSRDPRIEDVKKMRNVKTDMQILFCCESTQIARSAKDISQNTIAYVGPLESGIFDLLTKYGIEHIFTSFPDKKINLQTVDFGHSTTSELIEVLNNKPYKLGLGVSVMMNRADFGITQDPKKIKIATLTVKDLGLTGKPETDEVYNQALLFGLYYCPPDFGPKYRIIYQNQPVLTEEIYIGMGLIQGVGENQPGSIFSLSRDLEGLCLNSEWVAKGHGWKNEDKIVFALPNTT